MNVAFIGAGNIAQSHFDAFSAAGANVASVCTRGPSGAEFAKKNNIKHYTSLVELIEKEQPEAACVMTQPSSYEEVLKTLKAHDIPTLLEKPVSYSFKEGQDLMPHLPSKVMVGQNRRFYSNVSQILPMLEENTPVTAHFFVCERAKDIRIRPERDRDQWHILNAIHGVDLMKHLFGSPEKFIFQDRWGELDFSKLAQFNTAVYQSKNKHRVHFHSNFDSPGGWRINIFFKETEITFFPIEQTNVKNLSGTQLIPLSEEDQSFKQGFTAQAKCFLEGIKSSTLPKEWVSFTDALDSIHLAEQIYGTV